MRAEGAKQVRSEVAEQVRSEGAEQVRSEGVEGSAERTCVERSDGEIESHREEAW